MLRVGTAAAPLLVCRRRTHVELRSIGVRLLACVVGLATAGCSSGGSCPSSGRTVVGVGIPLAVPTLGRSSGHPDREIVDVGGRPRRGVMLCRVLGFMKEGDEFDGRLLVFQFGRRRGEETSDSVSSRGWE